ncbi:hypothetical protein SteCoe_16791 [Stentor coeruleus]|uniref:Protein kinase domain-containing protein n=1 Tax=Stentor coeruleus TaxID=5963 RepID=A0A1R2C0G8_9CILI|nr:hypothetical protein SteCoe_16791 [Stentor coeruleus]
MGCCSTGSIPPPLSQTIPSIPIIPQRSSRRGRVPTNKLTSITQRYEILKALGSGTIGTLFQAKDLNNNEFRAIREVNKSSSFHSVEVFQELTILKKLNHSNILKVYEAIETSRSYYIVLENISGGCLADKYKKDCIEGVISKYIYDMFLGLDYLHKQNIVHCNLSQEYVVLSDNSQNPVLKIIGFTLAQNLSEKKTIDQKQLKYIWASPEILRGEYSEKTDIWSAGVILYYLLTQRSPFPKGSRSMIIDSITTGNVDFSNSNFTSLSNEAQDLIKSMLKVYPEDRPSCEKILKHPWFKISKKMLPLTYNIDKKLLGFTVKYNIATKFMEFIIEQLSLERKDYAILGYFKSLDFNGEGVVSKEETVNIFNQAGISITHEIEIIIENFDEGKNGLIKYWDFMIRLTNWDQEFKKKNLGKIFKAQGEFVNTEILKEVAYGVYDEEWEEFLNQASASRGQITLDDFKKYFKQSISTQEKTS